MHFKSILSVQRPAQRDGTISRLADRVRPRTSTPQPPEIIRPYPHVPNDHFILAFIIDNPLVESARKMILYKKKIQKRRLAVVLFYRAAVEGNMAAREANYLWIYFIRCLSRGAG